MGQFAENYVDRFRRGLDTTGDLSHTARWIIRNTKNPKDENHNWSFKHHEYQVDIVNDSARRICAKKCSQVGFSEKSVRSTLAFTALVRNSTAIYTLPTAGFARMFTKQRIDTVIDASETLSAMRNRDVDSSEMKQLGNSFLYIKGTMGQGSAISIPADLVVQDEIDFSDQQVLTTYASRLGHAEADQVTGEKGYMRKFSTPTVGGYGISLEYDRSSQARYAIYHDDCGQWTAPDFMDDVVVPGFDDVFRKFEKEDLLNPMYKIGEAYLRCTKCRCKITAENMCNPEKRKWIHAFPDRNYHGYMIYPFDVPHINPICATILTMADYDRKADWVNFKVGVEYEDAENSFLRSAMTRATQVRWVPPDVGAGFTVAGLDQGKTSWLLIGHPAGRKVDVIYAERIRQDGEDNLGATALRRLKEFGVKLMVMDAGPDYTTAFKLASAAKHNQVYRCEYVNKPSPQQKRNCWYDEEEQIVKAYRTGTFDDAAKRMNNGHIMLPQHEETRLITQHLSNIKRIQVQDAAGEPVARWVKAGTGPAGEDHYAHALNYLMMAAGMVEERVGLPQEIAAAPRFTAIRLKTPSDAGATRLLPGSQRQGYTRRHIALR